MSGPQPLDGHLLLNDPIRLPVERLVSDYCGRPWRATTARDLADFASHPAAILTDGGFSVFVKLSLAADGLEQLETERASLQYLAQHGILTPPAIGVLPVPGGAALVLEALAAVERGPSQWRDIGRALARMHRIKGEHLGLDTHSYFGPFKQDNRPLDDWPSFYAERRLRPFLRLAVDSGHLPAALAGQVEQLIARLPELCGPRVVPALLHGDAQQNNFISTAEGAAIIDPAIYYGHPEIDLALLDYFQAVPPEVFEGYQEAMPIDSEFPERRELWRVFAYLGIVAVGGSFVDRLSAALRQYS